MRTFPVTLGRPCHRVLKLGQGSAFDRFRSELVRRMQTHDSDGASGEEDRRARQALVRAALATVLTSRPYMNVACLQTLLTVCAACETDSEGIATVALASQINTKHRTNVTGYLQKLREGGLVHSQKSQRDKRVDLNRPTEAGWALYDAIGGLPPGGDEQAGPEQGS